MAVSRNNPDLDAAFGVGPSPKANPLAGFDLKAVSAAFAELRGDMARQAKGMVQQTKDAMREAAQAQKEDAREKARVERESAREAVRLAKERAKAERESAREAVRLAKERAKAERDEMKEAVREQKAAEKQRAENVRAAFEAPTRAAAILRAGFSVLGTAIGAVQSTIVNFVRMANPAAVLRFQLALDDLYAVIGKAITPALTQFTSVLRTIGGAVAGLSGEGKNLLASMAAGAVGLVAFGAAALFVQSVMTAGLLPAFTAIAGALGGVALVSGGLSGAFKDMAQIFVGVADRLGGVLSKFAGGEAFGVLASVLAEVMGTAIDLGAGLLEGLMPALTAGAAILKALAPLAQPLMQLAMLTSPLAWFAKLGPVIEEITPYFVLFAEVLADVGKSVFALVKDLLGLVGISLPDGGTAPRGGLGDSTGAAIKSTGTSDVSSVLARARESAFKLGSGGTTDPATKSAGHLANIETDAKAIKEGIGAFLKDFPERVARELAMAIAKGTVNAATAVQNTVSNAARDPRTYITAASPAVALAAELYMRARDTRGSGN